jgi:uncharacterized protein
MDASHWLIYFAVGIPVGFLAGLLGIGGGSVVVPVLAILFDQLGFDRSHIMQLAIATSLACVMTGNGSATFAHFKLGNVDLATVRAMLPGVVAGSLVASLAAHLAPTGLMKTVFLVVMTGLSLQMLLNWQPGPHRTSLPSAGVMKVGGLIIGAICALVGIGGAVLSIAFLTWFSVPFKRAVGTASAIGLPIAVAGSAGYLAMGLTEPKLPQWSLGYIYLPAWLGISLTSIVMAPLGAKLANRLPTAFLKRLFIVFLLLLTVRMAVAI